MPVQWLRGLRCRSSATCLLRLWVWIQPGAWVFVCCECCVLSSRGLCDGLITRPEESYRLWCFVVCDQETSNMRRLKPATGLWNTNTMGCNARKTNKQTKWLVYESDHKLTYSLEVVEYCLDSELTSSYGMVLGQQDVMLCQWASGFWYFKGLWCHHLWGLSSPRILEGECNTTYSTMQFHILEELYSQQHHCENLIPCSVSSLLLLLSWWNSLLILVAVDVPWSDSDPLPVLSLDWTGSCLYSTDH